MLISVGECTPKFLLKTIPVAGVLGTSTVEIQFSQGEHFFLAAVANAGPAGITRMAGATNTQGARAVG